MVEHPLSALILGGGRSRRMGRDKRLISLQQNHHLLAAIVATLHTLELPIWFAGPAQDGARPELEGVAVLWDLHPYQGPLTALADAWSVVRTDLVVVGADLPRLRGEFLLSLVDDANAHPEAEAVIPSDGEFWQPLCAVYRTRCLTALTESVRSGEASLLTSLQSVDRHELRIVDALGEPSLTNWNRPPDRD
jgi:molybdopterin-guanine dinucleotide biosynthesis protein A